MRFDYKKAVQIINYLAANSRDGISMLKMLKLVFLADRYHLRKYGRMVSNDDYWAMTYGPVPSAIYDIASIKTEYINKEEHKYFSKYISAKGKHTLVSQKAPDKDLLSESDMEALDKALSIRNKKLDLVDFTHEFPEWKKHQHSLDSGCSRIKMRVSDFFSKADDDVEYCEVPEDILLVNKEAFLEHEEVEEALKA